MPRKRRDAAVARRLERAKPSEQQLAVMELAAAGLTQDEILERMRISPVQLRIALAGLADLIGPQPRSLYDAMEIARSFETKQFYDLNDLRRIP